MGAGGMRRRLTMGGIALAMAALAAGCGRQTAPVRIGAAGPWGSGNNVIQRHALELAVAEINERGGIGGRKLELVLRDDGASASRAVAIAEEFVDDPSIVAVVGHVNSGPMLAAARLYDGHLPAVIATATSPDLTGVSPWIFRVVASDSLSGATLAHAAGHLGWRRAAVLYENDSYGRGLAAAFQAGFGGDIVGADPIDRSTDDFEPYIAWYRRRGVDVVFVASSEDTGIRFLRTARAMRFGAALVGADGWLGVTTDTVASEGAYVATPFAAADARDEGRRFVEAYEERWGAAPDASAALAYDALNVVARAIAEGGPTREQVRARLARLNEQVPLRGVTGSIAFRADGDRAGRGLLLTRVRRGGLAVVWREGSDAAEGATVVSSR
ncbi:MAG TPA: ABC transporter substrate-binding protein [Gemmatimonadaceae bacterium]|nr:ABC transporter substrate-binding protein [Gemmatimonadaceae bacterium]